MSSSAVLSTLILGVALFALLDRFRSHHTLSIRWVVTGTAALVAGMACRKLDVAGRFSGPDAWFQGHAF